MERESFEDETTAALMNELFVCIKVDREERPDVDRIYMEACQAISGGGGWPLNAFLLPDGRPFYAGTYYPPVPKYNRPSWRQVLTQLAGQYRDNRSTVEEQAAGLTKSIASGATQLLKLSPESEDPAAWRSAILTKVRDRYDHANGGFGGAPKFPMSLTLEALLDHALLHDAPHDQHLAAHAMTAMLDGGIYDQLGGGFSRYTVDGAWRVPHFEKMLYDNALLLRLLGKLASVQPTGRFRTAIRETTDWLEREMSLPGGGYRAALDADSEGVEGKYYVWSLAEVEALLEPDESRIMALHYGLTAEGNWEEERTNIPYVALPLPAVATELGLPLDVVTAKLAAARTKLHELRLTRIPPGADDKLLLQWNALLISGWAACYRGTGERRYLDLATDLWATLQKQLFADGRWYRHRTSGQLGAPAFLDDLTSLAQAALDLAEITFDLSYVRRDAVELVDTILADFAMPEGPLCYLNRPGEGGLPVPAVELFDNAIPSGNSQLLAVLLRLYRLTGREAYGERGAAMLAAMAGSLERYPTSFGNWLRAALVHNAPEREVVVTGPGAKAAAAELLSPYRPGLLIVASEGDHLDLPLLEYRYQAETLRFFVCNDRVCRAPVEQIGEVVL